MSDIVERLREYRRADPYRQSSLMAVEAADEIESLRSRLAEADALLREARMGVENSAVQFGYPYTEYLDRIDAHLSRKEGET